MTENRRRTLTMLEIAERDDRWPELRALYNDGERDELVALISDHLAELRMRKGTAPNVRMISDETGLPIEKLADFVNDLKIFAMG